MIGHHVEVVRVRHESNARDAHGHFECQLQETACSALVCKLHRSVKSG